MNAVVSVDWLNDNLDDSDLIILDASLENNKAKLESSFKNLQIPNALFISIKKDFSDSASILPNMLLSPVAFEKAARELGISTSSKIIVYDNLGIYASPRVWWMFKTMGHENIAVLDGGLPEWIKKGYPTEEKKETKSFPLGNFVSDFKPQNVVDYSFIHNNISTKEAIVIDARTEKRFKGINPEPRKGLKSGHIPNSINIPFQSVLENGKFKSEKELKNLFSFLNTETELLVFSCGSGMTACIVLLACELIFNQNKAVYDGSWTEWGQKDPL